MVFILIADVFHLVQNIFLDQFAGIITEQTITAVNFVTGVILAAPFLIVLSLVIWAVVKGGSTGGLD